ncbi:peptide/nickel transport system substrate-binding protein [Halanaerobium saccharolyticum]|uniref:Peptide/nickel transport system substrate-binding protein n=1 Tax=Halanaerobium saccharolyticum TaxID=43595 RepID=A0A4V3CFT8_9FIRM|nr:ABC transporter substrate-binding protein [Halanaerobium saccharolyticum]TDO95152.1 peptide/nickel transport system substrate-binding protein [Halanaerobium saccharolyticum]
MKKKLLVSLFVLSMMVALFSLSAAAADGMWKLYNTSTDFEEETGKTLPEFKQAPQLSEQVSNGELPAVGERLPEEPVVVEPANKIGQYGGTWVRAWKGLSDQWAINKPVGERFLTFDEEGKVVPNIAKSWEIVDEGKGIIFHLRKGMKWSDGHPLTADDVLFWFNDIKLYEKLATVEPGPWDTLKYGDKEAEIKKIDDYTFKVSFAVDVAEKFLDERAGWGPTTMIAPRHYLKQFHDKYVAEEKLNAKAVEAGYDSWIEYFGEKVDYLRNPDLPVIFAWQVVNDYSSSELKLKRNPYYWKVDTAGNQLPYMDDISALRIDDNQVMVMQAISGNINLQNRHITIDNYPLLREQEDKGNYTVYLYPRADGANNALYFNHTLEDPVKRKLYNNPTFKKAVSLALNRSEINEMFYLGIGKPRQASFVTNSPFFDKEWTNAYTEYNPEKANQMLDELGMERGEDGYRLSPDGKPFEIEITIQSMSGGGGGSASQMAEVYKHYFDEIGLKSSIETLERSLMEERMATNQVDTRLSNLGDMLRPDKHLFNRLVPMVPSHAYWAPAWAKYYQSEGESGQVPPADVKRLQEIAEAIETGPSWEKRKELMAELADIFKEHLYIIGTVGEVPTPYVAADYMKNMPEEILDTGSYRNIARVLPIQIYIDKSAE